MKRSKGLVTAKRSEPGFTLVELLVVIAVIALLMAILLPALGKARDQAKRVICLSSLKQLTLAWMAYADNNNGKIVNGAPTNSTVACPDCPAPPNTKAMPSAGRPNEIPWIGPAWADLDGTPTIPLDPIFQKCAMESGALWRYLRDAKSYRCPGGVKGELITYIIVDSMNGIPDGPINFGSRGANAGVWTNSTFNIKKSAMRIVFIDEGKITPDSYAVNYSGSNFLKWFDPPMIRHSGGTTVSFADGHAELKKWSSKQTVDFGIKAEVSGLYNTYPNDSLFGPATDATYQDLYWMQIRTWGKLSNATRPFPPKVD
jgi:prepilin-type N-terminal cleavage/methylation domain-containing protein/prepilin-type processing-associated H-X9-DG protein